MYKVISPEESFLHPQWLSKLLIVVPQSLRFFAEFSLNDKSLETSDLCSYYVTYAFQSESTLYSCLNVKELLARSRREI